MERAVAEKHYRRNAMPRSAQFQCCPATPITSARDAQSIRLARARR